VPGPVVPGPVVIDLGVAGEDAAPPRAAPRPATRHRIALAGLVAAVSVAVLGAATPAPAPALAPTADIAVPPYHRLWSVGAADLAVLATDPDRPATTLTSYALADGTPRWAVAADPTTTDIRRWPERGMLFAVDGPGRTTAFDVATGARLWQAPGRYTGTMAGLVLLAVGTESSTVLHVADPSTGRDAWSFTDTMAWTSAYDEAGGPAGAGRVVVVADDGTTTLRRIADGAEVLRGRVDRQIAGGGFGVLAGDGLLHTVETVAGDSTVAAYRLDTLAPLWRRPFDGEQHAQGCGPLLCLSDGATLRALDPRTGAPRWANPDWAWVSGWPPDRLIGYARIGGRAHHGLLDPATGRTLADLGDAVIGDAAPGRGPATLVLRQDRADASRTVVERVDAAGGVARIGAVADVFRQECVAEGVHVVCPTAVGSLRVWRIGRPPEPRG
jgi:hypothetical protein